MREYKCHRRIPQGPPRSTGQYLLSPGGPEPLEAEQAWPPLRALSLPESSVPSVLWALGVTVSLQVPGSLQLPHKMSWTLAKGHGLAFCTDISHRRNYAPKNKTQEEH